MSPTNRQCARPRPQAGLFTDACRRRRLRFEEAAFGLCRRRRLAGPYGAAGRDRAHLPAPRFDADPRKFTPHVTLARLRNSSPVDVAHYLSARGNFSTMPFRVGRFVLMSSRESVGGGPYIVEEAWPLVGAEPRAVGLAVERLRRFADHAIADELPVGTTRLGATPSFEPTPSSHPLAVSFQEVVHSDRTEETGVTKLQHSPEGPNEHPQECPSHAATSRGDGAVGISSTIPRN